MPKRSRRASASVGPRQRVFNNRISRAQYRQTANEHSLQVSVLEYLRLNAASNVYWFAIPNAGRRSYAMARRMKAEGLAAGVADLCVMLDDGHTLWIEFKTGSGRQSTEQRSFHAVCDALKHPYYIIRDLAGAIAVFKHWNMLKGPQ